MITNLVVCKENVLRLLFGVLLKNSPIIMEKCADEQILPSHFYWAQFESTQEPIDRALIELCAPLERLDPNCIERREFLEYLEIALGDIASNRVDDPIY